MISNFAVSMVHQLFSCSFYGKVTDIGEFKRINYIFSFLQTVWRHQTSSVMQEEN